MKAKGFDNNFEAGENLIDDLALSKAHRINQESNRVNIDFHSKYL